MKKNGEFQVRKYRLIGNTVRIGDGPAAVTPSFSFRKWKLFQPLCATVPASRDGKAAKRGGESENLPGLKDIPPRTEVS